MTKLQITAISILAALIFFVIGYAISFSAPTVTDPLNERMSECSEAGGTYYQDTTWWDETTKSVYSCELPK